MNGGRDKELSRVVQASLYAIVSALPSKHTAQPMYNELFYGLSPTGLGRGGGSQLSDYEGWSPEKLNFLRGNRELSLL